MNLKHAAVLVHIYKSDIDVFEKISLTQLNRILGAYDVILVAPEGLNVTAYRELLGDHLREVVTFNAGYFTDLHGYNKLLLSRKYYKPLLGYDFVLLHHTDSFVFRNELDYWIEQDFDNIGAPFYAYDGTRNPTEYIGTGNGGLVLRKVKTFYDLAGSNNIIYGFNDIKKDFLNYNWKGRIARTPYYAGLLAGIGSRLNSKVNTVRENEDVIWGRYVSEHFPAFKTAPFDVALKFGMEFNCDKLIKLNDDQLPFGCHGWYKPMFIEFWKKYVEAQGYEL